jgi:hypothetical protein
MRTLLTSLTALAMGSAIVLVPSPATAAATEFGNACLATNAAPNFTIVATASATGSAAAPVSGVITKARFSVPPAAPTFATVVKIVRPTGIANQYRVVAQSPSINVPPTVSTQDVRLPVTAGDLLGLHGSIGTLHCDTAAPGDTAVVFSGDAAVGSAETYSAPNPSLSVPVVATIEPDADKDGYGDTTQDLCPQSAAFQTACPVVVLDSFAAPSGKTVTVVVATSTNATVKVAGTAKVNGKKIKLKGGSKSVTPGTLAKFKVKVPAALKAALAAIPPGKSIKIKLTASATDMVGRVTTDKSSVKLPGTKR